MAVNEEKVSRLLAELSYFFLKQGMLLESRVCLEGLSELRPEHPTTHLLNGMFAFAIEKYAEAEKHYRRILDRRPDDADALVYLAESLIAQQRWREAENTLRRVPKEPDGPTARFAAELLSALQQGVFQRAGGR